MRTKTVYYEDALGDDFAGTKIKQLTFYPKFKYIHRNVFWRSFSWFVYYAVALPILWIVGKIGWGMKTKGRKNLRELHHRGCFVYGNHTQISDAWSGPSFIMSPKRTYIMANQDAVSIKGIRAFVVMMGCLPVPEQLEWKEAFKEAVAYRYKQRAAIMIFPEKHIWPYMTHIRPFPEDSFVYPSELGAPVVATCTTYRKARFFGDHRRPKMTIHISKPIYPDMSKSLIERKKILRDEVYDFMIRHAAEDENVEYIRYIKRNGKQPK
jgi:1-acyl-sn-glycerol-3-phosphate acyltransferase